MDVDPSTWETEGQVIWLVDVVEQQDITPSLTPLGLMSEKEAIDKAIALATRNQPEINASRAKLTNIKARKSTIAEAFQEILSISAIPPPSYAPTDPVWIVTMDGEWSAGFPSPTHVGTSEAYRHLYVILDAKSGAKISLRTYR